MRATNVLARFASLLDVTIILLGLMMLMLSVGELTEFEATSSSPETNIPEQSGLSDLSRRIIEQHLHPILLYAGFQGERKGRCYLLDESFKPGREIDTESKRDIQRLVDANQPRRPIILLLSPEGAWDDDWNQETIERIEKTWGYPIIRVVNVAFPN